MLQCANFERMRKSYSVNEKDALVRTMGRVAINFRMQVGLEVESMLILKADGLGAEANTIIHVTAFRQQQSLLAS